MRKKTGEENVEGKRTSMKERERRLDKDARSRKKRRREREAGHGWGRDEDQGGKLVCGRAWKEGGRGRQVRRKTGEERVRERA